MQPMNCENDLASNGDSDGRQPLIAMPLYTYIFKEFVNWKKHMPSLQYINSKLSDVIYTLTIHEGDARKRIAAALPNLKNSMTYRLKPVDCGQTKVLLRRFHGGLKPLGSCLQGVI